MITMSLLSVNPTSGNNHSFDKYQILKLIFLSLIIITGLIGNLLVCIAIIKSPKLRKVVNYFILSLAVSDLLVCGMVMPLAIYQEVKGEWRLEKWVCHLWILNDVLLSTASIWNLCLVSIDRFLAITQPIKYPKFRTLRNAILAIMSVWVLSLVIAILIVFATSEDTTGSQFCQVDSEFIAGVISVMAAFFVPCCIILCLYIRIFIVVKKKVTNLSNKRPTVTRQQSNISMKNTTDTDKSTSDPSSPSPSTQSKSKSVQKMSTLKRTRTWTMRRMDSVSIRREAKTAIVLGIVMAAFIGCWLPYFIIYVVQLHYASPTETVQTAFQVATWLGWCNSIINPFIYTIFNEDFRNAFMKIVCLGKL